MKISIYLAVSTYRETHSHNYIFIYALNYHIYIANNPHSQKHYNYYNLNLIDPAQLQLFSPLP